MNLKYNWLLLIFLLISIFFVFFIDYLYYVWIFMELNTLMFLVFLGYNMMYISNYIMKYFLVSSFSSFMFMFFVNFSMMSSNLMGLIFSISMYLKLGVIPFHFWFVDMMTGLTWFMCFFLSTIQKLIPLFILMKLFYYMVFLFMFIFLGGLINMVLGFNFSMLKKIMSYSSINHMYWMLIILSFKFNLMMLYFYSYFLISGSLMYLFDKMNLFQINDIYNIVNMKFYLSVYIFLLMFSLGGLPPFFGFMMKLYSMMNLISMSYYFLVIFLILNSLFYLYYYIFLSMGGMLIYLNFMNLNFFNYEDNFNYVFFFISLSLFGFFFIGVWFMF